MDVATCTLKETCHRPPSIISSPPPLAPTIPTWSNPTLFGTSVPSSHAYASWQATSSTRLPQDAIRPRKASIAERRSGTHGLPPRIQTSSAAHASLLSATSLPVPVAAPHSSVSDPCPTRHHSALEQHQPGIVSTPHQPPEFEQSSAPIDIPARQKDTSRPTTPLTAREDKGGFQFPFHNITPKEPQISQSLRPTYQHNKRPERNCNYNLTSPQRQVSDGVSSLIERTPSPYAPLSPTIMNSTLSPSAKRAQRAPPAQNLKLPTLPRFHPANYQSTGNGSLSTTPVKPRITPLSRPPRSPVAHNRQVSDAQQKLYQYQREVIRNASRVASLISPQTVEKPPTPQILPCGSPGTGPATPLMLEDSSDYMMGGFRSSSPNYQGSPSRDAVDRMIHEENQRGNRALHSPRSPAVSPAGGRI